MNYKIVEGDCFELIKNQPDNSVDLVITSPPYSDIVNYGKNVSTKKPDDYVDWILPLFNEIQRILKPSGSFILNINDKCENGLRSTYIYDLISRNNKETKLKPTLFSKNKKLALSLTLTALLDNHWTVSNGVKRGTIELWIPFGFSTIPIFLFGTFK